MKVPQVALPHEVTDKLLVRLPDITPEAYRKLSNTQRTKYEQVEGQRMNVKAHAEWVITEMKKKYDIKGKLELDVSSWNPEDWFIKLEHHDVTVVDKWGDFPSEEFRTMLMLLGEM